jgi:hypothetical protein
LADFLLGTATVKNTGKAHNGCTTFAYMFLHNINYDKFNMMLGNTLTDPHFGDDKPFDAIVSNCV